jgi:cation diffusion facilitator family transporter
MATQANPQQNTLTMHPSPFHKHPAHESTHTPIPRPQLHHGSAISSSVEDDEGHPRQRTMAGSDTEGQPSPPYTHENDPFRLSSRIKTQSEINLITANTGRKRDLFNPLILTGQKPPNKLQGFYEAQNSRIERLLTPVDEHVRQAKETNSTNHLRYQIAVYGSFTANLLLAILQSYAAIASSSLSLFTTMADAIFDPASNLTLLLCHSAVSKVNPRKFPAGKARIETAGNIVFCFLMTAVSILLVAFSLRSLIAGHPNQTTPFHLPSTIAVSIAFATKLTLFLYCTPLRSQYSQIRILWLDHRNDLIINGLGILTSVLGAKLRWYIDPAGALTLALLIASLWLHTAYREFQLLIGVSADTETLQLITYISMTHSAHVLAIDTVRAWHSGPRLVVEVDLVMAPEDSLRATHDIAEALQCKLESLPDVERAYVHVDYETTHKPEHFLKKEL